MKLKLGLKVFLASLIVAGAATGAYAVYSSQSSEKLSVPDFTGKDVRIVEIWGNNNNLTGQIVYTYDFSEEYKEDIVIEQSKRRMSTSETLRVTVSKGYDPDKLFTLPDFTGQSKEEIEEWFEQYHFSNVSYEYETVEDSSIEVDTFVSMTPGEGEEVLRTDEIVVTLATDDITLPDLASMNRDEISAWGEKWGVTVNFVSQESNTLADNQIISFDPASGTILHRGDTVNVVYAVHVDSTTEERTNEETNYQQSDTNNGGGTRDENYVDDTPTPVEPVNPDPEPVTPVEPEQPVQTSCTAFSWDILNLTTGQPLGTVQGILNSMAPSGCNVIYSTSQNANNTSGAYNSYADGSNIYVDVYVSE